MISRRREFPRAMLEPLLVYQPQELWAYVILSLLAQCPSVGVGTMVQGVKEQDGSFLKMSVIGGA